MQEDGGAASSLGSLEVLSEEVILLIFSFVTPPDLAKSVGSVCKTFHRLVGDQQLYATLFDGN